MAENTHISWTDSTFNPWIGCTKISPACDGCYAAALMGEGGRMGRVVWGEPGKGAGTRSRTSPSNWMQPRKWDRQQAALIAAHNQPAGKMPKPPAHFVFCASLADVFDNEVPAHWRRDLFDLIRATPNLTWLLLTKRPQMIVKLFRDTFLLPDRPKIETDLAAWWPRNAAIGTTIEDRARLANAIALARAADDLGHAPAFTFWSCEPLIEDLGRLPLLPHWVITGGETDQGKHKARPTHPDWFRSLRDQCAGAGVPYHHKQNGEWSSTQEHDPETCGMFPTAIYRDGRIEHRPSEAFRHLSEKEEGWAGVCRVGKKRSGRLLDGVLHDARPEI